MNSGIWPWRKLKSFELHDGVMRNLRMKTAPFYSKQSCCWFWQQELLYAKNTPVSLVIPIAKVWTKERDLNLRDKNDAWIIFIYFWASWLCQGLHCHIRCAHSCSPFAHRSTGTNGESGMQLPRGTETHGIGQKESGTAAAWSRTWKMSLCRAWGWEIRVATAVGRFLTGVRVRSPGDHSSGFNL